MNRWILAGLVALAIVAVIVLAALRAGSDDDDRFGRG